MEKFEGEKLEINKEKEAEIEAPEFNIVDFEATKYYFANLAKQLTSAIRNHEYNLVIGDDASGRIPTLVIGGLMKEVYREDKANPPHILFLTGKSLLKKEEQADLDSYLHTIIKQQGINSENSKILLVTEYIEGGRHVANFIDAFKRVGLSCDVATLLTRKSPEYYRDSPDFKDVKTHIGDSRSRGILAFLQRPGLSGVTKPRSGIFAMRSKLNDSQYIKQVRESDVKKMVDYLKQIYDREKEKLEKQDSV